MRTTRLLQITGYYSFILIGWAGVLIPSLIRSIQHDFHQTDAGFGLLYLLGSVAYGTGGLVGGLLTERIGRRLVLVTAPLLAAAGLTLAGIAPWWIAFLAGATIMSCGNSILDSGGNGLFLDLFQDVRGGALNFLHLFFSVGALIAPVALGLLVVAGVPWRLLFFGVAAAFLVAVFPLLTAPMPQAQRQREPKAIAAGLEVSRQGRLPIILLACAIACYVGGEVGVSGWLVKFLDSQPLTVATGALSTFWLGLALGRLISRWAAEMMDYTLFAAGCCLLMALTLIVAVLMPWIAVALVFYGLAGLFSGPIYPMIVAIGGAMYPQRASALAGALTLAAAAGGFVYPPLMGLMAGSVGLQVAMIGAGLLGVPAAAAVLLARVALPASSPD